MSVLNELMREIIVMRDVGAVIYGAGQRGLQMYEILSELGVEIAYCIDRDPSKKLPGIATKTMEEVVGTKQCQVCVISPAMGAKDEDPLKARLETVYSKVLAREWVDYVANSDYYFPQRLEHLTYQASRPFNHYESPFYGEVEYQYCERDCDMSVLGVDLNVEEQRRFLGYLGDHVEKYARASSAWETMHYQKGNAWFERTDAMLYSAMITKYRPRRIIEIGSGFSTAMALDTARYLDDEELKITCIEPFPDRVKEVAQKEIERGKLKLVQDFLQNVDLHLFEELKENDILFVDSSHVLKMGGDVAIEYLKILPMLPKGVVIHIHDIFFPFRYPLGWVSAGYSYNEVYMLHALLLNNPDFEILFWEDYMLKEHREEFAEKYGDDIFEGSSFWMRKK